MCNIVYFEDRKKKKKKGFKVLEILLRLNNYLLHINYLYIFGRLCLTMSKIDPRFLLHVIEQNDILPLLGLKMNTRLYFILKWKTFDVSKLFKKKCMLFQSRYACITYI